MIGELIMFTMVFVFVGVVVTLVRAGLYSKRP